MDCLTIRFGRADFRGSGCRPNYRAISSLGSSFDDLPDANRICEDVAKRPSFASVARGVAGLVRLFGFFDDSVAGPARSSFRARVYK